MYEKTYVNMKLNLYCTRKTKVSGSVEVTLKSLLQEQDSLLLYQ